MYVAQNLTYLMKLHRLSGKSLAEIMGWKATVISSYKTGGADPPLKNAVKLAEYFNVSLEDFVNTEMSKGELREKPKNANDEIIIELLMKEIVRLRAEKIAGGHNEAVIDKAIEQTIKELRAAEGE